MPWRTSLEWSSPSQREERGFKSRPGCCIESPSGMPFGVLRPVRLLVRLPVFQAGQRGSKPLRAADSLRGRLTVGRQALNLSGAGSIPAPGSACPGGETDIMARSERAGPGSIPGRGADECPWSVPVARDRAKVEGEVQLLTGILWPNPKRMREPAVNRFCVGSTPTGHPVPSSRRCSIGRAPLL